jgi:hypothetical protein
MRIFSSSHGIYYFVPGILKHFDTEAIYALVAPRPMLQLSGDQDRNAPPDGIEVLERKLGALYQLYGQPECFQSVLYKNTGHEYLPDMRTRMVDWFEQHLPPGGREIRNKKSNSKSEIQSLHQSRPRLVVGPDAPAEYGRSWLALGIIL